MAKNYFTFIYLLFSIGCIPHQRSDVLSEQIPIIITETDTVFVTVEIEPTIAQKYETALRKYLGVREATGKNDGEEVASILKSCGILTPAPWCGCLLNKGLIDIGLHGPYYQPAFTPRWFQESERIVWTRNISDIRERWEKGWIGGIYFRNLGRVGHVAAILEDFTDGYVLTIEGNTNSAGSREGDGVFIRIRHKSEFYIVADWLENPNPYIHGKKVTFILNAPTSFFDELRPV